MGKPHMTAEQRALALRLRARGLNFKEIGEEIDASLQTAWNVIMKPRRASCVRSVVARTRAFDAGRT